MRAFLCLCVPRPHECCQYGRCLRCFAYEKHLITPSAVPCLPNAIENKHAGQLLAAAPDHHLHGHLHHRHQPRLPQHPRSLHNNFLKVARRVLCRRGVGHIVYKVLNVVLPERCSVARPPPPPARHTPSDPKMYRPPATMDRPGPERNITGRPCIVFMCVSLLRACPASP